MVKRNIKYVKKLIETKTIPDGQRKTIQLHRADKKALITLDHIRDLVQKIETHPDTKRGTKLVVIAQNIEKRHTLKGYNTTIKSDEEMDACYSSLVDAGADIDKFRNFFQVQIIKIVPDDYDSDDDFFLFNLN